MIHEPACAVCGGRQFEILGRRTYTKDRSTASNAYVAARMRVLFQVWMPEADEAVFASLLCRSCGFIAFSPRPSESDLIAKYEFLAHDETARHETNIALASDRERGRQLFDYIRMHVGETACSLLDYGGGNGRLLGSFLAHGYACSVCDFIEQSLPGIEHAGRQISDIPADRTFDLIVCSRVLEHLADPGGVVRGLLAHLNPNGRLYVEVPLEVWDGAPLPVEPVTHINFFTPGSLRVLAEESGLEVVECAEATYLSEEGGRAPAVRLLARRSSEPLQGASPRRQQAVTTALRYVHPRATDRLLRYVRYPDLRTGMREAFARRFLPRQFFWRFMG